MATSRKEQALLGEASQYGSLQKKAKELNDGRMYDVKGWLATLEWRMADRPAGSQLGRPRSRLAPRYIFVAPRLFLCMSLETPLNLVSVQGQRALDEIAGGDPGPPGCRPMDWFVGWRIVACDWARWPGACQSDSAMTMAGPDEPKISALQNGLQIRRAASALMLLLKASPVSR
jgi:hypothetical protein